MKHLPTFERFVNESLKEEQWQVIFYDDNTGDVPYTIETFKSKKEAEDWAESHEFEYDDEWYNPRKDDYEFKTFTKYHNPEDKWAYSSFEVKKIK